MKNSERLLNLIGEIDEKYIVEGDPTLEVRLSFREKVAALIKNMRYSSHLRPVMTVLVVAILLSSVIWLGTRLPQMGSDEAADMDAGSSTGTTSEDTADSSMDNGSTDYHDDGDMVEEETDEEGTDEVAPEEAYSWYDRYMELDVFPEYYDVQIYSELSDYDIYPETISIVYENNLGSDLYIGQAFTILKEHDEQWEPLGMQYDDFTSEEIILEVDATITMPYNLDRFVNDLDQGHYKFVSSIVKAGVEYRVEAEFTVGASVIKE